MFSKAASRDLIGRGIGSAHGYPARFHGRNRRHVLRHGQGRQSDVLEFLKKLEPQLPCFCTGSWQFEHSAAGNGTRLLLNTGPKGHEPLHLLDQGSFVETRRKKKSNHVGILESNVFGTVSGNPPITGYNNPLTFRTQRFNPLDIRNSRPETVADMKNIVLLGKQCVKCSCECGRQILVNEYLQAALFRLSSKRTASRTTDEGTSNNRATSSTDPSASTAWARATVGTPYFEVIG